MNEIDQEAYEERAAIMEYCGKLPRAKAEAAAHKTLTVIPTPPPEKQGKHFAEFQQFWHNRKRF
jgi:hypothetical protein